MGESNGHYNWYGLYRLGLHSITIMITDNVDRAVNRNSCRPPSIILPYWYLESDSGMKRFCPSLSCLVILEQLYATWNYVLSQGKFADDHRECMLIKMI